jgi:hypothetical protein
VIQRLSDVFGISHDKWEEVGVFDKFVGVDSQLHVDPHLLQSSSIPEMKAGYATFITYWEDTLRLIKAVTQSGDRVDRAASNRFVFHEVIEAALGYSKDGARGSAIGPTLAATLYESAKVIIRSGIDDPTFFELVGVFESDIGPDRISDVVVSIALNHFLEYTERICAELEIAVSPRLISKRTFNLPIDPITDRHVIFFPMEILRSLPTALDWDDVDLVCAYNDEIRNKINAQIGQTWKEAVETNSKKKIKEVLLENPAVLADLIQQYREKPGQPYDFATDILGENIWYGAAQAAAAARPLDLATFRPVTPTNILPLVRAVCDQYRALVEENSLWKLFYTDSGKRRHERVAQMLFFAIADTYCLTNNLDISPEVNSGPGPVDFKFSVGKDVKVLVEVKWSSNSKLLHGFETQLEIYARAERTSNRVLLVIKVTDSDSAINAVLAAQAKQIQDGSRVPDVKVIDGRKRRSASKS